MFLPIYTNKIVVLKFQVLKNQVESVDEKGMVLTGYRFHTPSKLCFNGSRLGSRNLFLTQMK